MHRWLTVLVFLGAIPASADPPRRAPPNETCDSLAKFCANGYCPPSWAAAQDLKTWHPHFTNWMLSVGSCNATTNAASLTYLDTGVMYFFDGKTGALVGYRIAPRGCAGTPPVCDARSSRIVGRVP